MSLGGFRLEQQGSVVTDSLLTEASVVIYRRWRMADTPMVVSTLADDSERQFAEREWTAAFAAILRYAEEAANRASWINRYSLEWFSRDKLTMLRIAAQIGLVIPPLTVATRAEAPSPDVVAKAINVDETIDAARTYPTTVLTSQHLEAYLGHRASCPSLLQKRIDSDYELRVFVIRDHVQAVRVETGLPHDDIRYVEPAKLSIEPTELPGSLRQQLVSLTERLGFAYCAFDLLHASGEFYLIDITPNGRWGPYDFGANEVTQWVAATICGYGLM